METWTPVKGFETHYEISSIGRIRCLVRRNRAWPGKIISQQTRNWPNGKYKIVKLRINKKRYTFSVHRLMLLSFIGDPPTIKHQAAHKNGVCSDNRIENLYWATYQQNLNDKIKHGATCKGSKNGSAKLTEKDIPFIKQDLLNGCTCREIALKHNVCNSTITHIKFNRTWTHLIQS